MDDPKRQVGAYLALRKALFEVVEVTPRQVLAQNCRNGYLTTFNADELAEAELIVPLTDEKMVGLELAVAFADAPDPMTAAEALARHFNSGDSAGGCAAGPSENTD